MIHTIYSIHRRAPRPHKIGAYGLLVVLGLIGCVYLVGGLLAWPG